MKLDRAGGPFVIGLGAITLVLIPFSPALAVLCGALLAFTVNFFRDPERRTPDEPGALISPADGKVIRADASRVSIFMNVFDVHVCRSPVAGRVTSVRHEPGRFVAAMKDEASEHNERTTIVVQPKDGPPARFVLVAGLVARRIVCRVAEGRELEAGDRVGIIRFGSRVDVDLPEGVVAAVRVGARVVAGESVVARRRQESA
jgi:phosphatidylserine decarboxylase